MNGRTRLLTYFIVPVTLLAGTSVLLIGCQKKEVSTSPTKTAEAPSGQPAAQVAEQINCPVMGGPIDKSIFVEYQGKKVYFCCKSCVETFKANPEKYLAKLPQFAR